GRGVIAWEEGRDLGHVLWMAASESRLEGRDRTVAYLWQLFVAAPWRGRPLAGRLLAWAVADAAARGYDSMELLTPRPHARARRFYEREGWTLAGPGGWDAELRMELVLYRRGLRRE
ncbi:MAG: GNAT family N-acetyltransferase, partial [Solirubrobacterales bacterium]|nr:GNAT family N-acetyltransferase [Solirubrobacterales bacterium]